MTIKTPEEKGCAPNSADFVSLVLAAGAGRRFGGGKLLSPFGAGLLMDGAIAAACAAPVSRVIVVTGAQSEAVAAHARTLPHALEIVHAPDWAEGMSASLKRGVAAAGEVDGVFVFLADMPRIPHAILPLLAQAVVRGAPAAAPVHAGQRGHPALLGRPVLAQIGRLSGDLGAAQLLGEATLIETDDDGVLFDVDTRAPD